VTVGERGYEKMMLKETKEWSRKRIMKEKVRE
jgi:hypothetical protein